MLVVKVAKSCCSSSVTAHSNEAALLLTCKVLGQPPAATVLLLQGPITLDNYTARMEVSWVAQELDRARNIRPGFRSVKHHCGPVDLYTMQVPKQLHVSTQCMTAEVVHFAAPGQTTDMFTVLAVNCSASARFDRVSSLLTALLSLPAAVCCSKWGLWGGLANAALSTYLLRGREPWTLRHRWGGSPGGGLGTAAGTAAGHLKVHWQ
jgi:hypothetical protein